MKTKSALYRMTLLLALATPAAAFADQPDATASGCDRQFEVAQRIDMESFRDYDADTFRAIHTDDAVTIFASGAVRYGIDSIMLTLASHFQNREAIWSWTELYRNVEGCKTAYILYDTVYEIPSIGFRQNARVGVTYTHDGNGWLAVADQSTRLP